MSPNDMKMHPSSSRAFQKISTWFKAFWFCEILLEKDARLLLPPSWLTDGRREKREEMKWNEIVQQLTKLLHDIGT